MFVPLKDDNPLVVIRAQYVTGALIAANAAVFLLTLLRLDPEGAPLAAVAFGVTPAELTGRVADYSPVPEGVTLVSYMFLHGGWLHLLSNMLFLWVFGDNVEDAFGHVKFLLFYLACGIAAALAHVLMLPASPSPLIGASGAVAGVMAAYLLLYPRARVWVLLFMRIPLRLQAMWALAGWFVLQILSALLAPQEADVQIAWWAHIGGFVAGLVLTPLLRSRPARPVAG